MKEDIPHKFWREYEESDILERKKKIKHIVDMFDKLYHIKDNKVRKHAIEIGIQGYFDDLIGYIQEEERKENP